MREKDDFDLALFLPYLLNQAAERSSLDFQRIYRQRYGMLRTDWRVLFHLGLYGRMTAQDIGARASIHKTKISRAVHRLEALRFLRRTRDAEDRRREFLDLTPQGQRAYVDLLTEAAAYDAVLTRDFHPDEVALLRRLLVRLAHAGTTG